MTNGRINKRSALLAILCVLVMVFAVPVASAASYSKVYGQTQDKVRVRESASTNATIIDNIVKDACIYITSSKTSGSNTFVQVKYRASDGSTATGWVCQSDGRNTYVKVLSTDQAKSKFKVSSGNLPSKAVGTFTAAERKASAANSDTTYIRENSSGATVSKVQTELKALGYYYGQITGNAGPKTVAAIKSFQGKNGLTADGIAGPQTIAKIDAAYEAKGGSSSGSGSSASGLKLNSKGTDVRNLQQDLTTLGYYWAEITGNFGAKTETAVKRFQEENGLTADGVAGTKTLNAIAAAVARKGGTPASGSSAGTTLKLNSQGTKVSQLQTDLKQLGYYYAEITGNFGEKTEAAVKAFQKAKGLTADGVAGKKTLDAIAAAVDKAGGSSSGSSSTNMKLGSTGTAVSALQQNLTTLGYYYGDVTGHYGNLTQQAVKKFQKAKGLTQDGVASTATLNAITSALKNAGVDVGPGTVATTLREGDKGTAVTELQTMLKKLNYYYGSITGSFGSLTKQAVRKFQDANKLTVDGVAGPATINKLRSLTGGSADSGSSSGSTVTTDKSYGRTTKDNVYLRSSYSTTSSAKASLQKGQKFRISKVYTVSGVKWYYVTVTVGSYTYKGYIRGDMMENITAADFGDDSNSGEQETIGMIKVTGNNVSLRYQPSTSADRVGTANIGDCFYYVDTVNGWFQTKSGYWITKDYAKVMTDAEVEAYIKNNGGSGSTGSSYTIGSTGSTVTYIQTALTALEYYDRQITGHYGRYTKDAVRAFQRDNNLTADGVCGAITLAAIQKAYSGSSSATTTYNATVYKLDWSYMKSNATALGIARGASIKLTDLTTGKSLNVHVQSTGNHIDAEPLTSADTTTLCEIYGVSTPNAISYKRRPMMITTSAGQFLCSIYGQPHGAQDITNNGYEGQFCLHFVNSKTHGTNRVDEDHQNAINTAETLVKAIKVNGVNVVVQTTFK